MRDIISKLLLNNRADDTVETKVDKDAAAETDEQEYAPSISEQSSADVREQETEVGATLDEAGVETARSLVETMPTTRPLAETAVGPLGLEKPTPMPAPVAVQRCHIGNVRQRNEDSSYVFSAESGGQEPLLPFGLYIVADGMGGHHAGHEASRNVSRLVAKRVLERIYLPLLQNSTVSSSVPQEPVSDVMLDAVQSANAFIHNSDPQKDSGTTLTAALIFGRRLYVAHVGDSRAYLLVDGELKLLTTDHSYVRRLQDAGQLTEEEAALHPQRNMLYKAVGQGGRLEIDAFTQTLPDKGTILLCSDGLWGLVSDNSMQEILESSTSLPAKADELVARALQAGGHDNITAVLVDFG